MPDPSYRSIWLDYQSAWKDVDQEERRRLLRASVADECVYIDPAGVRGSKEALIEYLEQFQQRMPGAYFVNTDFVTHHDRAIAHWTRYDGQGNPDWNGASSARFGRDGRLIEMIGFPDEQ